MQILNILLISILGAALITVRAQINDNFESAIALSGTDASGSGTNSKATRQMGEPSLTGQATLWWSWNAPVNGLVTIDTDGSTFDTVLAVFTGDSRDRLSVVAANNDTVTARTARVTFQAAAEETYRIAVGVNGIPSYGIFETRLQVSLEPNEQPASVVGSEKFSDRPSLAGADAIGVGYTDRGTLWWSWTPPVNGLVVIDNLGSEPYAAVKVYVGSEVSTLLPVRQATWNAGDGTYSAVNCQVAAGMTYQIAVSVPGSVVSRGNVRLNVHLETNSEVASVVGTDDFYAPHELAGTLAHGVAHSLGAGMQLGETKSIGNANTVWWSWTPQFDGIVVIDTLGSDFDTTLHVFTGQFVNSLTSAGSNDNYNAHRTSRAMFKAEAHRRYHITVAGSPGVVPGYGNIDLHLYQQGGPDDRLRTYPAVEVELFTTAGRRYQLQKSPDLVHWENVGDPFYGINAYVNWFFPTRPGEQEFFRAKPVLK